MLTLSGDTERRSFARGRIIGRTLDRLEWVAHGMLARLFDGAAHEGGQVREALLLESVQRKSRPAQHLDHGGTDVVAGCHTTSYAGCD